MSKTIVLKVQQLNGRFVVNIPSDVAMAVSLSDGQLVSLKILKTAEEISLAKAAPPTLEEMLDNYDPDNFGGEVMAWPPIGQEIVK